MLRLSGSHSTQGSSGCLSLRIGATSACGMCFCPMASCPEATPMPHSQSRHLLHLCVSRTLRTTKTMGLVVLRSNVEPTPTNPRQLRPCRGAELHCCQCLWTFAPQHQNRQTTSHQMQTTQSSRIQSRHSLHSSSRRTRIRLGQGSLRSHSTGRQLGLCQTSHHHRTCRVGGTCCHCHPP